jgi:hypothetical protein
MRAADLAKLIKVTRRRGEWFDGLCVGHDDHAASLSFCDGDVRVILTCRAGCTDEQIATALGITVADLFFEPATRRNGHDRPGGLTLDAFAKAKGLPVDFLRQCGVEERGRELQIAYRLADGALAPRQRRRWALAAKDGTAWMAGDGALVPYGLDRLDEAREKGELLVVEGETDGLTGWYHNVPTLGLPGADTAKLLESAYLRAIERIYVVKEPDRGGETFIAGVAARLRTLGWTGQGFSVVLPAKDLNDLHREAGPDFAGRLQTAIAAAVPLDRESPPDPGDRGSHEITVVTIDEVLAVDPGTLRTEYIVAPYIPRGGLIANSAKAGVGKTKLLQDLCIARATGGSWLGLDVEPGPALFWSGEQGRREDFRVFQAFCRGRGIRAGDFAHYFGIISDPALRFGHPMMLARVLELARTYRGLFIGIDSIRRAFEGEDIASDVADTFFRTVLLPLRAAGATILLLAHPPKTSGNLKRIEDENMIRGSGDFAAQLDGFMVLRPITRKRTGPDSEDIVSRLTHPKARGGRQGDPLLVTLHVTRDDSAETTFMLTAAQVTEAEELEGALKAAGLLAEEVKRFSRAGLIEALAPRQLGRKAVEAALEKLLNLGVIRGPLDKTERLKGERGHWYVFLKPLPLVSEPADDSEGADEDPDDL